MEGLNRAMLVCRPEHEHFENDGAMKHAVHTALITMHPYHAYASLTYKEQRYIVPTLELFLPRPKIPVPGSLLYRTLPKTPDRRLRIAHLARSSPGSSDCRALRGSSTSLLFHVNPLNRVPGDIFLETWPH